jgi:hypothetical protein
MAVALPVPVRFASVGVPAETRTPWVLVRTVESVNVSPGSEVLRPLVACSMMAP